jgi:very-short-patch-repair endonuclease
MIERAREMRNQPTETEELLWKHLRRGQLNGLHFRRQRPIGNFIVDFYCESLKLTVEVDGEVHNDTREYDEYRTTNLNARGVSVMRFSNNDILHRITDVLTAIRSFNGVPLPRLAGGAAPTASGEGSGVGAWVHSTKKNLLFIRGFGELSKRWPEPVAISIDDARKQIPAGTSYVGELIGEHRDMLTELQPAGSIKPLTDILPAFIQTLKFEMKSLEPWYGREG